MKTYEDVNRENYQEVLEEIKNELNETFIGEKVKSPKYGEGTIKEINDIVFYGKHADVPIGIAAQVAFEEEIRSFYINLAIKTNFIVLYNVELKDVIKDAMVELEKVADVQYQVHLEEIEKELEVRKIVKEAELATKKEYEARQKLQKKQEKILNDLNKIKRKSVSVENTFYNDLGWIAGHVGSISAQIPDYLENWFDNRFGKTSSKTVINSLRKTSGGFAMKWNPSFTISFKKVKDEEIPASLYSQIKRNKINNVGFVFDLIENYGFTFGKTQNIDEIRKCIPTSHIEQFELGLKA